MSPDESSVLDQPSPTGTFWASWDRTFCLRPVHVGYALVMLLMSVTTFGLLGTAVAGVVVLTWAWVFLRVPHRKALREAFLAWMTLVVLVLLGSPAISTAREAARRVQCANNLKVIAVGLHSYWNAYGSFPPAYFADDQGRPMHSWRVLVLPFVGEAERYARYRFDEPWDGPHNRQIALPMPSVYACGSDPRARAVDNAMTSYFAIVGSTTARPGERSRPRAELLDGESGTVLLVESHAYDVHWMEPKELDVDTALRLLTVTNADHDGHVHRGFFCDDVGRYVACADGTVKFVGQVPAALAESLISGDDSGTRRDAVRGEPELGHTHRPHYLNAICLGVWVLLVLGPLPRVFPFGG